MNFPAKNKAKKILENGTFQTKSDGYLTIPHRLTFTLADFRQAEMLILVKIAFNFDGKIQMWMKSVHKNLTLKEIHFFYIVS